jgi:hypothetical protein
MCLLTSPLKYFPERISFLPAEPAARPGEQPDLLSTFMPRTRARRLIAFANKTKGPGMVRQNLPQEAPCAGIGQENGGPRRAKKIQVGFQLVGGDAAF